MSTQEIMRLVSDYVSEYPNDTCGAKERAALESAIESLTAERDAYAKAADDMAAAHKLERDALKDAARLALDALEKSTRYFNIVRLGESRLKDTEVRGNCHTAMKALKAVL